MSDNPLDGAKSCPFCAYAESRIETLGKEYVVMCLNCGAFGPSEMYAQRAIVMWNLRREEFPTRPTTRPTQEAA